MGQRRAGQALLLLAAEGVLAAAFSLLTIGRIKDVLVFRSLHGEPIGVGVVAGALRWEDGVLGLGCLLVLGWMAWVEWRTRAYSRLLAEATPGEAFWLVLILAGFLGHAYLGAGVLLGGDTGTHIARFLEVSRGLAEGRLAQWTNYQYAGAPLLWFTGPLTYVAGGVLAFAIGDAVLATKALLFVLHLASGVAFFALLLRLGFRPGISAVAAVLFAGSFAHLHLFLYRGVIPQAFTIVFLVLLLYAADGALRARGSRAGNFLLFALCVAGLIVNHQPHALFAGAYLAVFALPMFLSGTWRWPRVPLAVGAGLIGLVCGMVAVWPVLREADWVMIEPDSGLFRVHLPTATRLLHLLLWRNTRTTWGIDYWAYLGLGTIGFGAAGVVAVLRRRVAGAPGWAARSACLCLPLCLVLYNPVVRDIIFLLFFACLLAAAGLEWCRAFGRGALLLAVVVALLDLASTSIQPVARTDKEFLVAAGERLEQIAGDQRVLELNVSSSGELSADIGPDAGPQSYFATIQRIAGNHNMAATRAHNFLVTTAKLAEAELRRDGVLGADAEGLLGLFNVSRVICHSPIANGCPDGIRTNARDEVLGRLIAIPATPIVFSTRLVPLPRPDGLDKPMLWDEEFADEASRGRIGAIEGFLRAFLQAERADFRHRTADAIAVAGPCDPCGNEAAAPPPALRRYAVGLDRVEAEVELPQAGFIQLAHPWFPSQLVTVNGATVQPIRGALDLVVLPLGAGTSRIVLQDRLTPAREVGLLLSLAGLLLAAAGTLVLAWRDRRPISAAPARLS